MEEIFREYSGGSRTGLLRITMATGSGKTHAMVQYIADCLIDAAEGRAAGPRNIIVTSSQKKNLPLSELKEALESRGYGRLYDEQVLFLDSYIDLIRSNYRPWMEDGIRKVIADPKAVADFFVAVSIMQADENGDIAGLLRDKLSMAESGFRSSVKRHLRSAYLQKHDGKNRPGSEQLLSFVKKSTDWSWLPALYPQVLTSEKKVFFMSVDKFLMRNDTIVGGSSTVFDSGIVKGSIVFIDEFDASKMTMERRLIQNSLEGIRDYRDSFEKIHKKISDPHGQPSRLYAVSERFRPVLTARLKNDKKFQSMSDRKKDEWISGYLLRCREEMSGYFQKISEEYRLDKVFKTDRDASDETAFLFHDRRTSYISRSEKCIGISYDEAENVNRIRFADSEEDLRYVYGLCSALRSAHRRFYGFVKLLASNYQMGQEDQSVSFEDSVRTVLSEFMIDGGLQDMAVSEILLMPSRKQKDELRIDESFYDSGFRYYSFEDDDSHGLRSNMKMVSQSITPEKVLLSVCRNAMVFGISATADLQTAIGNFDLRYLKKQLRNKYFELTQTDRKLLEQRFEDANSGYTEGQIAVHELTDDDGATYNEDCWDSVIKDGYKRLMMFKLVQDSSDGEFTERRYLKAAKAFHGFAVDKDITAMLAFFNKHPAEGDSFNGATLKAIFCEIIEENRDVLPDGFSFEDNVVFLNKKTLRSAKPMLDSKLAAGKKMFVITAYGTLGAGQNLQYIYNEAEPAVCINGFGHKKVKDYNAIYIEKPTNIIPFYAPHEGSAQLIEHMFTIEYLFQNREITASMKLDGIRAAFLNDKGKLMQIRSQCNKTRSARLNAAGTVIQAVGRICRTNMKSPKIHIFADSGLRSVFTDPPSTYGRCINLETRKLIETMHAQRDEDPLCSMEDAASYDSQTGLDYIDRMRSHWNDENVRRWESLREFVLRHPVDPPADSDEIELYVKTPAPTDRYYYESEGDLKGLRIHFSKPASQHETVSEESARLQDLLKIGFVRKRFESEGYATGFQNGTAILSPPLFKNIYKGALGETAGKEILEHFGIRLHSLPVEKYELFDFLISDGIAVDFKHWSSAMFTDSEEQRPKILQKMESAGISKAFIINILKAGDHKPMIAKISEGREIVEISYLYDPERNRFNTDAIEKIRGAING